MKPFIKWAGGKEKEIKYFSSQFPKQINNYYEPFLGGGSVYFYMDDNYKDINNFYVNDYSKELMDLYKGIKIHSPILFETLDNISTDLQYISLKCQNEYTEYKDKLLGYFDGGCLADCPRISLSDFDFSLSSIDCSIFETLTNRIIGQKLKRLLKVQSKNKDNFQLDTADLLETAMKSAYYTYIRQLYNSYTGKKTNYEHTAYFYFIREYCYSSMFRYNQSGEFNVPYGGMAYNKNDFTKKLEYIQSDDLRGLLKRSNLFNQDFEEFLTQQEFGKDDFIFVDPPYDTEFSDYDRNSFDKEDQTRLACCLRDLYDVCKIMVVIKNTEFISNLYLKFGFKIQAYDKKYGVNFMNRNVRDVNHLIITNY